MIRRQKFRIGALVALSGCTLATGTCDAVLETIRLGFSIADIWVSYA